MLLGGNTQSTIGQNDDISRQISFYPVFVGALFLFEMLPLFRSTRWRNIFKSINRMGDPKPKNIFTQLDNIRKRRPANPHAAKLFVRDSSRWYYRRPREFYSKPPYAINNGWIMEPHGEEGGGVGGWNPNERQVVVSYQTYNNINEFENGRSKRFKLAEWGNYSYLFQRFNPIKVATSNWNYGKV